MRRWSTSTASAGRALALVSVMTTAAACNTPHRLSTLRAPLVFHAPARVTVGAGALLSASSPQLRAAALHYPRKIAPAAPISLTASDGTGLELVEIDARAVLEGPLAFTELRLSFRNPQRRRLEGRFSITLPDGAAQRFDDLAVVSPGWEELRWLGFVSNGAGPAVWYIDNIEMRLAE